MTLAAPQPLEAAEPQGGTTPQGMRVPAASAWWVLIAGVAGL